MGNLLRNIGVKVNLLFAELYPPKGARVGNYALPFIKDIACWFASFSSLTVLVCRKNILLGSSTGIRSGSSQKRGYANIQWGCDSNMLKGSFRQPESWRRGIIIHFPWRINITVYHSPHENRLFVSYTLVDTVRVFSDPRK